MKGLAETVGLPPTLTKSFGLKPRQSCGSRGLHAQARTAPGPAWRARRAQVAERGKTFFL